MNDYDSNGVRTRRDGEGDSWALDHRQLGAQFNMIDIDGLIGLVGFAVNTGNRLFVEYVPDGTYNDRFKSIRKFAVVAVFDRKADRGIALGEGNRVSQAFYLWLCRVFAQFQPRPPRFFYVFGQQGPSYEMLEMDISTGTEMETHRLEKNLWKEVWESVGLVVLRQELLAWIKEN